MKHFSGGSADAGVTIVGGAVDLGGSSEFVMDNDAINATWFTSTKMDSKVLQLARLTLSSDATGTWSMRLGDACGSVHFVCGTIRGGVLQVETGRQ